MRYGVRADLFDHLQLLSMAYHDEHKVGDLMSRVTNDTEAINRVLSNGLNLMGVPSYYQQVIKGTVFILAVMLDLLTKRRR